MSFVSIGFRLLCDCMRGSLWYNGRGKRGLVVEQFAVGDVALWLR